MAGYPYGQSRAGSYPVSPTPSQYPYGQSRAGEQEQIGSGDDFGGAPEPSGLVTPSASNRPSGEQLSGLQAAQDQFLKAFGLEQVVPGDVTVDNMIEVGLTNAGADPTNPAIQAIVGTPLFQSWMANATDQGNPRRAQYQQLVQGIFSSIAEQYPDPYAPTQYEAAAAEFGFDVPGAEPDIPKVAMTGSIGIGGALGASAGKVKDPIKPGGSIGVQKDPSGAKMYANGVIYDPNTQTVVFPENDPKVAGSTAWISQAQKKWTPDTIQSQVSELIKYGYLGKEYKGAKTMSIQVMDALRQFHTARYLYGNGKPVPSGPEAAGAGGGGLAPEENLRNVRAGLAAEVRNQMSRVFGPDYDPSAAEVKEWTEFVIRSGNKLQTAKNMPTSTAAQEAIARMGNALERSPNAEWDEQIAQEQEENTQLRDGLAAAAAATSGIIGWRS